MVIFTITLMFLDPGFWLPDEPFADRFFAGSVAILRENEGLAAKAAFNLSLADPQSPEAARLREVLDVHLQRLDGARLSLDKRVAGWRLTLWKQAQTAGGRKVRY